MMLEDPRSELRIRQYTVRFSGRVFFEKIHRKTVQAFQEAGILLVSDDNCSSKEAEGRSMNHSRQVVGRGNGSKRRHDGP